MLDRSANYRNFTRRFPQISSSSVAFSFQLSDPFGHYKHRSGWAENIYWWRGAEAKHWTDKNNTDVVISSHAFAWNTNNKTNPRRKSSSQHRITILTSTCYNTRFLSYHCTALEKKKIYRTTLAKGKRPYQRTVRMNYG